MKVDSRLTAMGSPAHAGIDPIILHSSLSWTRFPRTREDRPIGTPMLWEPEWVPPHTRG